MWTDGCQSRAMPTVVFAPRFWNQFLKKYRSSFFLLSPAKNLLHCLLQDVQGLNIERKKSLNFFKEKRRKDKNDVFPSKISKKIFQKGWLTFYNQIESRWHILDICRPQSTLLRTERPYFGSKIVSLAFWGLWALGAFGLLAKSNCKIGQKLPSSSPSLVPKILSNNVGSFLL